MRCHDNVMSITNPTNPIPSLSEAFPSPHLSLLRSDIPTGTSLSSHLAAIHDPGQRLHFSTGSNIQRQTRYEVHLILILACSRLNRAIPAATTTQTTTTAASTQHSPRHLDQHSPPANTNPTLGSIHKIKSRPSPSSPSQSTYRLPLNISPNAQAPTHKLSTLHLLQSGSAQDLSHPRQISDDPVIKLFKYSSFGNTNSVSDQSSYQVTPIQHSSDIKENPGPRPITHNPPVTHKTLTDQNILVPHTATPQLEPTTQPLSPATQHTHQAPITHHHHHQYHHNLHHHQ